MGWWKVGGGSDGVIGDEPADAVAAGLAKIRQERASKTEDAPTVKELVDGLAAVLAARDEPIPGKISARLTNGRNVESHPGLAEDSFMVIGLREILQEIDEAYMRALERPPRLPEILENFAFILGYRPDRYLSCVEGVEVQEIAAL